jgi:hypothetical protein
MAEKKKPDFKVIAVAAGGYLKKPEFKMIELNKDDEEFDEAEFKNFKEYCDYVVEDACAEWEQRFASTVVLTPKDLRNLVEKIGPIED